MSILSSKFDIVSVETAYALAALAQILEPNTLPSPTVNTDGTPVAGSIYPGMLVKMNSSGKAELWTTPDISAADKDIVFVVVDGDVDYSGAYSRKLTCLHGGITIKTDQYDSHAYVPAHALTGNAGKFAPLTDRATQQLIGFVGPNGLDATNGILEVIMPQGVGL